MEPIGCPETSVQNYHCTLRNIPEKAQISSALRRKPEITHSLPCSTLPAAVLEQTKSTTLRHRVHSLKTPIRA